MRILKVVHGFVPEATGGVELRCYYLAREMARHHDVRVFCRTGDPSREDYEISREERDGFEVARVHYNFGDAREMRDAYVNERIERLFEEEIDAFRPDVVHAHHLTCLSTTLPAAAKRRGVPVVLSLHDFWLSCPRGQIIRTDLAICDPIDRTKCLPCLKDLWPGFQWSRRSGLARLLRGDGAFERIEEYDRHIREVLRTPDQCFAPCDFHREKFIELGVPADRIRTMNYGFDREMFAGVAGRRRPSDKVRIGYIGSVIPTKGVHVLLEAFAGMDPDRATLDIYGEIPRFHGDDSYARRIDALTGELSGAKVHGRYENRDLPDILARIDVLVVPSVWYETFSITIREGFMAGIPVVASGFGAMGEAIEDGVTGLHFRAGDAGDLREKLVRLVEDPELRRRLVEAPKPIEPLADNAARIVAIYEELAARVRTAMT